MSVTQFESTISDINGWKVIQIPRSISLDLSSRGMVMASELKVILTLDYNYS